MDMTNPSNPDKVPDAPTTHITESVDPTLAFDAPADAPTPVATVTEPRISGDAPGEPDRLGIRMRTVVLGLVLLVIGVSVLIGQLTDISIDLGAIVLAVMIGCGLLLVAGARRT
jgi:hypothetical protein